MLQNKGFSRLALIIIAVLILGGGYWVQKKRVENTATCVADAKFCAKGSLEDRLFGGSVGRRPPTCDFVPCPNDSLVTKTTFWFKDKLSTLFYFK